MMMGTTTRVVTATATALSWLFCRIRGRLRVTSLALMRRLHKSSSTRRYARAIAAIGTTTLATAIHMWPGQRRCPRLGQHSQQVEGN